MSSETSPSELTPETSIGKPIKPVSRLLFALMILLVLLSVPLVLGFFGRVHPALDSFAHFRAHLAAIMALGGLVLLFTQLRREAAMIMLLGVSAFSTTVNWQAWGSAQSALPADSVSYRLMQINLQQDNSEPKSILQSIARNAPDVITYQEASEQWQPWLEILQANYPYHHQCSKLPGVWGVGILSRRPFSEFGHAVCTGDGVLASALINFGGTNVLISSLHHYWPWPYRQAKQFDEILPALLPMRDAHGIPVIIAGDFNAAPWSYATRRIEMASDTKHLSGIGATWLTKRLPDSLKRWVGLPIDQILINETVTMRKIGKDMPSGSDHLPVLFEFSVPAPLSTAPATSPVQQPVNI